MALKNVRRYDANGRELTEKDLETFRLDSPVVREILALSLIHILSSSFGQWYVTGFNHDRQRVQVFRCDKIIDISESECYIPKPRQELLNRSTNIFKSENATDFEVQILDKGVDLFYKENYPSMELIKYDGQYKIKGFYNVGEERFIADYFLSYGKLIKSIYPEHLKKLVSKRAKELYPVSYTHLDVYKRQSLPFMMKILAAFSLSMT